MPKEDVLDPILEVLRRLQSCLTISKHLATCCFPTIRLSLDFQKLVVWKLQDLIMTKHSIILCSIARRLLAVTFDNSDFL